MNSRTETAIEVRAAELRQIFGAMDPSPFNERDIDHKAAEYIVDSTRELPRPASLALLVHLDRYAGLPDESALLGHAIRQFFGRRANAAQARLKLLFRSGRVSLIIAVAFLTGAFAVSRYIGGLLPSHGFDELLQVSVVISGWVAM